MIVGAVSSGEARQGLGAGERVIQALGIHSHGVILGHGDQGRAGNRADPIGQTKGHARRLIWRSIGSRSICERFSNLSITLPM